MRSRRAPIRGADFASALVGNRDPAITGADPAARPGCESTRVRRVTMCTCRWQDAKDRALADGAVDQDLAAVQLDQTLGERESQASAFLTKVTNASVGSHCDGRGSPQGFREAQGLPEPFSG